MKRLAIAATLAAALVGLFHATTGGVLAQILQGDRIEIPATPASLACDLSDPGAYIEGDPDTGISRTCTDDELAIVVGQDTNALIKKTFLFNRYGFTLPTVTFSQLSANAPDGTELYCSDCAQATPCAGSGTGAHAARTNSQWECSAGGGTISGTANTLPKFNATGDGLTDSQVSDNGSAVTVNATGDFNATAAFSVNLTGADLISQFSGTIDLIAGAGPGPTDFFLFKPAAGGSGALAEVSANLLAMNGADTVRGFFVNLNNASHTGASNQLIALDVDAIVGSANATEYAINIGSGWDIALAAPDNMPIQLGNLADASILWDDGNGELDITSSAIHETAPFIWTTFGTGAFDGWFVDDTAGTTVINLDTTPGTSGFFQLRGDLDGMTAGGAMLRLRPSTFPALASGTFSWIYVEGNSANHTGGTIVGLDFGPSTADAQASEYGIRFPSNGYDQEIKFAGALNMQGTNVTDSLLLDMGADYFFGSPPLSGVGGDLMTITATLNAMNGGDDVRGLVVGIVNADHTVGSNSLTGIEVAGITGDAEATEYGILVGTDWDKALVLQSDTNGEQLIEFESTIGGNSGYGFGRGGSANNGVLVYGNGGPQINLIDMNVFGSVWSNSAEIVWGTPANATGDTGIRGNSGTGIFAILTAGTERFFYREPPVAGASGNFSEWALALTAMDGADAVYGFQVSPTNANHTGTGNIFGALFANNITGDAEAIGTAFRIGTGYDAVELVAVDTDGWSPTDNPPTNHVVRFYDESLDRGAGTAAADCAEVYRLSDGTEVAGDILVTDGGCP